MRVLRECIENMNERGEAEGPLVIGDQYKCNAGRGRKE